MAEAYIVAAARTAGGRRGGYWLMRSVSGRPGSGLASPMAFSQLCACTPARALIAAFSNMVADLL